MTEVGDRVAVRPRRVGATVLRQSRIDSWTGRRGIVKRLGNGSDENQLVLVEWTDELYPRDPKWMPAYRLREDPTGGELLVRSLRRVVETCQTRLSR